MSTSSSTDLRVPAPRQPTRRRRGPSEYLSLLHLDQGRTPAHRDLPCPRPSAADSAFTVPAGSRLLGGLIIPPFFSLSRNTTREPPRSFLGALIDRFAPSRPSKGMGVVHIARGHENEVVLGKTQGYWEDRDRAQQFLDSFLEDCLKKDSSVYTPEEKVQMNTVQETLTKERQQEAMNREKSQSQEETKEKSPRRQHGVKERKLKEKSNYEDKNVKKLESPERAEKDDESSLTLASELSRDLPLLGRTFREKVRIYNMSGTEVDVNGTRHSPRPHGDANMAGDSRRNRDDSQSPSSETETTLTEESLKPGRQVELGEAEVEFSQSMISESREILQELQVDQAKEIKLNKMIIEENKRTLKKLQRENREDLKQQPCPQKEITTSRRVKENKSSLETNSTDIRKTKSKRQPLNDQALNETTNVYKAKETREKVSASQKVKGPVNESERQHERKKYDSNERIATNELRDRKNTEKETNYQKEGSDKKKNNKKNATHDIGNDCKSTKVEVVYRNKNFLNMGKESASQKLKEHVQTRTTFKAEHNKHRPTIKNSRKDSSSQLYEEKCITKNSETHRPCDTHAWKRYSKDANIEDDSSEAVKKKLQEISDSESSSLVTLEQNNRTKANKGVQCQTIKTRMEEISVGDCESCRMTLKVNPTDIAEKDYPTQTVTIRRPTREVAECDSKSAKESNLKKPLDDTVKPVIVAGQSKEMQNEVKNRAKPTENILETKCNDMLGYVIESDRDGKSKKSIKDTKRNTNIDEMDNTSSFGIGDGGSAKETDIQRDKEEPSESHLAKECGHGVSPVLGYAITRMKKSRFNSSENSTTSDSFLILCDGRTSRIGCVHNRLKIKESIRSELTSSSTDSEEDTVEIQTSEGREQKSIRHERHVDVTKKVRDVRQRYQKPPIKNDITMKATMINKRVKSKCNKNMNYDDGEKVNDDVDLYFKGFPVPDAIKQLFQHKQFNEILKNSKDYHGMGTEMRSVPKQHSESKSKKSHLSLMKKHPSYKLVSHRKDVTARSNKKRCHEGDNHGDKKMIVSKKTPSSIYETFPMAGSSKRNVVMHVETVGKVDVPPCRIPEETKEDKRKELLDMLKSVHEKAEKLGRVRRVMEVIEERTNLDEKEKSHLLADMMVAVEKQNNEEGEVENQVDKKHTMGKEIVPVPQQELCLYASEGTREARHLNHTQLKDASMKESQVLTYTSSPRAKKEKQGEVFTARRIKQVDHAVMTTGIYQKQSFNHKITCTNDTLVNIAEKSSSSKGNRKQRTQEDEKHVSGTFRDGSKPKEDTMCRTKVYVEGVKEMTSNQLELKQPQAETHGFKKACFNMRSKQMDEHMASVVAEYLSKKRQYERLKEEDEDSQGQQEKDCRVDHGDRRNVEKKTKFVQKGQNYTLLKTQTRNEKDTFPQQGEQDFYDCEDNAKELYNYIPVQSINMASNAQSLDQNATESNKGSKVAGKCKGSEGLGDVESRTESRNVTTHPSKFDGKKSKRMLFREKQGFENIMSLSHKTVKALEFAGCVGDKSNNLMYQSGTGAAEGSSKHVESSNHHLKDPCGIHVQQSIVPSHQSEVSSKVCVVPTINPCMDKFEHSVPYVSNHCPQNPLQFKETHYVNVQQDVPEELCYDLSKSLPHHTQQNILGCTEERLGHHNSTVDCITKEHGGTTHVVSDEKVIEIQSVSNGTHQTYNQNTERQDVLELMPRESIRTCDYQDLTNVVSRIDSPDKAMQEIFKKMDDVIVNRFLTLASVSGITIVVTPKLVINEENQDGGGMKESYDQQTPEETKLDVNRNEAVAQMDESKTKVNDTGAINEKEEMLSPDLNENISKIVTNQQVEYRIIGETTNKNICADDQTKSTINKQQNEPKGTGVPQSKRSRLESAASCSFNKKEVYFVSRTFCKSTGAIRKEKKLQMRLRRGRATRTRNKSWRGSGTIARCHYEPIPPAKLATDKEEVEVSNSGITDIPEGETNLIPDDLRILEEITFINVPDTPLKSYDRCFDELLNCTLPSNKHQVGTSSCEEDGVSTGGKGGDKQEENPVDSFLEKVRKNLDDDELKMLEESSKTSSLGPTSGTELEVIYARGPSRPSDSTISTAASHIRTIEDIISEADNEDRQLSICECFGVTNMNDLMDSLGAGSRARSRRPKGRVRGMRSSPVTTVKRKVPPRSNSDVTVAPELVSLATNTSLPPPGPMKKPSRPHRHYQDKDINKWIRGGAMFNRHDETQTDESVVTSKAVKVRRHQKEESADRVNERRMRTISGVPLSEFVRNYALKSGIILGRPLGEAGYPRACGEGYDTTATEDASDCVNVKIELNGGGGARTDIVIQVPEGTSLPRTPELAVTPLPKTAEQASVKSSSSTPPRSRAQIVYVDSEEMVLTTETPEVAAWTEQEEREFEHALKKHRPRPNVWNKIARNVGRSKRECVLHFLDIWKKLDSAGE